MYTEDLWFTTKIRYLLIKQHANLNSLGTLRYSYIANGFQDLGLFPFLH